MHESHQTNFVDINERSSIVYLNSAKKNVQKPFKHIQFVHKHLDLVAIRKISVQEKIVQGKCEKSQEFRYVYRKIVHRKTRNFCLFIFKMLCKEDVILYEVSRATYFQLEIPDKFYHS